MSEELDLSKVTLLDAIEWFKKENYKFMNGHKGYENCRCFDACPFHILYVPREAPRHKPKAKVYSELGYLMTSYMSDYDLFVAVGNLYKERDYMALGMFKDNDNVTRLNVKGINHIVKKGNTPIL